MASSSILFTLTTGLALCALHCSADDTNLPGSTSGSSNATAGQGSARGGTAGSTTGSAGSAAGRANSGGGAGLGAGGATGGALGTGGAPAGGAGSGGSSGAVAVGAGAGGFGSTGGAPFSAGGTEVGAGSVSNLGGGGGMSGGVSASGASGSGTAGSGVAGSASSAFAPVADIISLSCATTACHPNDKMGHANLHNADGKLYERLLKTGATIPSAKDACKSLPLVVPGSPETSLIMAMIVADDKDRDECGNRMPYKCPDEMAKTVCLTDPEIETIRSWIAAGALP